MKTLEEQIHGLARRLSRIEQHLALTPEPHDSLQRSSPVSGNAPQASALSQLQSPTFQTHPTSSKPQPQVAGQAATSTPAESSGGWLGAIAVICFVLAAIFLVRLAIDSGWLTPERQFGLSALFGGLLIAAAYWIRNADESYSGYLAGAGVIVLYLASYGGYLFFHVFDPVQALFCVGAVGTLSLFLRKSFQSDLFSVTSAIGVFAGPLLLGKPLEDVWSIASYYVIWSTVFCAMAIRLETRVLALVSAYCAFFGIGALGLAARNLDDVKVLLAAQTIQFAVYTGMTVLHSIKKATPLTSAQAWSYFPLLIFFYLTEYGLLKRVWPEAAPWVSLGFALLLNGGYLAAKGRLAQVAIPSGQVVMGFTAIVFFQSVYLEILPSESKAWLMLILLGAAAVSAKAASRARLPGIPAFLCLLVVAIELGKIFFSLAQHRHDPPLLHALLAVPLLIAIHLANRSAGKSTSDGGSLVLGTAHVLAILAIFRLVERHGSLAVSAAWGAYAGAVLIYGFASRDAVLARSSTVVLMFATGKVLLHDISASDPLARIVTLIMTGAILYFSGFIFRKIQRF